MGTKYTIVVINAYFHLILNVKKEGSMRSRVMWVVKVLTWGIKISYDDPASNWINFCSNGRQIWEQNTPL